MAIVRLEDPQTGIAIRFIREFDVRSFNLPPVLSLGPGIRITFTYPPEVNRRYDVIYSTPSQLDSLQFHPDAFALTMAPLELERPK